MLLSSQQMVYGLSNVDVYDDAWYDLNVAKITTKNVVEYFPAFTKCGNASLESR